MLRILRFVKIISFLNATESVKLSLKLFKLIFYLLIYVHWQACLWYFYTSQDQTWFPLTDLIQQRTDFYEETLSYRYCLSVWHSVSILNGEEMVPVTDNQAIIVSILVIVSDFIHANILGTISVIIQALSIKSQRFQEQIEFATSTMKNIKLAEDVQHKIVDYLTLR